MFSAVGIVNQKGSSSMEQIVVLKGKRDGITINLDASAEFKEIEEALRQRIIGTRHFFQGVNATLSFKGRKLSQSEEESLLNIVLDETTMNIAFVESDGFVRPAPAPDTTNIMLEATPNGIPFSASETAYYRSGLRSGQSIRYNGSVVIIGDVNPGSEVVADGNVVVLGALKGMAHAGALGDDKCYIAALELRPTQMLRIGKTLSYIPAANKREHISPEYAYIENGEVFIASLV